MNSSPMMEMLSFSWTLLKLIASIAEEEDGNVHFQLNLTETEHFYRDTNVQFQLYKTGNEELFDDEKCWVSVEICWNWLLLSQKKDENAQFHLNLTETEHFYRDKKVQFQLNLTETEHFYPGIR